MLTILTPKDGIPKNVIKSVFLAGPTVRNEEMKKLGVSDSFIDQYNWRKDVIKILESKGFEGTVFSPEFSGMSYEDQLKWEDTCLNIADCILFWVPRDMHILPGLTTNVEFGEWMKSGKVVLGFPPNAEKVRYLASKAAEQIPVFDNLENCINQVLKYLGMGEERSDGEVYIPIQIWKHKAFKQWYNSHKKSGNYLNSAKVQWVFKPKPGLESNPFLYVIHANMHIKAENRDKTNEVVVFRPDISTILAYHQVKSYTMYETLQNTKVVLTKEFRTPVSNNDSFVYELPGGSSFDPSKSSMQLAADELEEETSLKVENYTRFIFESSRQISATLAAHKANLFSIELTDDELHYLQGLQGKTFGVEEDTEKTYVEVKTIAEIMRDDLLDWSMIGMILSIIAK